MHQSIKGFINSPPPPHLRQPTGIWLSSMPKGEEFEPWMGGDGKFEPEWSRLSNWINVFYLLTWRCWKVKSSLLLVDGSVEKAYKKARVTNLPSTKRLKIKSCTWVGHLNTILVPWRVEFEPTKLQKFKCLGGCPVEEGRRGWSFKLTDALCCGK